LHRIGRLCVAEFILVTSAGRRDHPRSDGYSRWNGVVDDDDGR
jgi:hypothetical protein